MGQEQGLSYYVEDVRFIGLIICFIFIDRGCCVFKKVLYWAVPRKRIRIKYKTYFKKLKNKFYSFILVKKHA
jgi:hypothetical protein